MPLQERFLKIMQNQFHTRRKKNPRYSLRAFGKSVGLSSGAISGVMRGELKISADRVEKIIPQLALSSREENQLLALMGKNKASIRKQISSEGHELLTDWVYIAVLFSFDMDASDLSPAAIARRLQIPELKVEVVIMDLLAKKMLEKNAQGRIFRTPHHFAVGDGPPSAVIRQAHRVNLELAQKALETIPAERRDFSSLTFAGTREDLELVRNEIRHFYSKVSALMENPPKNEVFRLSISLFPLNFDPNEVSK